MTDRYQPLRDAIAAGPASGPWEARAVDGLVAIAHPSGWVMDTDETQDLKNARYIAAADPDTIAALLKERDHLHEECHEQARLLGMSGSREAKLLAERDALRAAIERHRHDLWGSGSVDHSDDVRLYAALAALADGEASNAG